MFTGVNIANDFTRLLCHYPSLGIRSKPRDATKSDCRNTYASNHLAHASYPTKSSANMDTLLLEYLAVRKPHESERISDQWSKHMLSNPQITYAAVDALLSAKLWLAMKARHPDGEVAVVGDAVKLMDSGDGIAVAHGTVVPSPSAGGAVALSARTLHVEIKRGEVLAPGTIVHEPGRPRSSGRERAQLPVRFITQGESVISSFTNQSSAESVL